MKSIIVYLVLLFVIRIMGKRQLGEMQPFELVITLIIAEVACIPLNDPHIPLHFGLIPTLCLAIIHILFSLLARHSLIWRKAMSGKSVIAIDNNGINYKNLVDMNMNISDLLEAITCSGSPDILTIKYAIFETNGQMCVINNSANQTPISSLPIALVIDGKVDKDAFAKVGTTEMQLKMVLTKNGVKETKYVALADVRADGTLYISLKKGNSIVTKLAVLNTW